MPTLTLALFGEHQDDWLLTLAQFLRTSTEELGWDMEPDAENPDATLELVGGVFEYDPASDVAPWTGTVVHVASPTDDEGTAHFLSQIHRWLESGPTDL